MSEAPRSMLGEGTLGLALPFLSTIGFNAPFVNPSWAVGRNSGE
jgi:hypothetical protein